jgi:hypothetical protein
MPSAVFASTLSILAIGLAGNRPRTEIDGQNVVTSHEVVRFKAVNLCIRRRKMLASKVGQGRESEVVPWCGATDVDWAFRTTMAGFLPA